jgi:hypothetical protein
MSELEWQPLPSPMWPAPAVFTDVGDFTLLVFTQNGVPTWEVRRRATLAWISMEQNLVNIMAG